MRHLSRTTVIGIILVIVSAGPAYSAQTFDGEDNTPPRKTKVVIVKERDKIVTKESTELPLKTPDTVPPSPEDRQVIARDYPISAGDTLSIEIAARDDREGIQFRRIVVEHTGKIKLTGLGRVDAAGFTAPALEARLRKLLREREIGDRDVTVQPLFLQKATYFIFGIGTSASRNAPLRSGTFPLRRPDLTVREALIQVGAMNELVPAVHISRTAEGSGKTRVIRIPGEHLRYGDPDGEVYVRAGDVIYVMPPPAVASQPAQAPATRTQPPSSVFPQRFVGVSHTGDYQEALDRALTQAVEVLSGRGGEDTVSWRVGAVRGMRNRSSELNDIVVEIEAW